MFEDAAVDAEVVAADGAWSAYVAEHITNQQGSAARRVPAAAPSVADARAGGRALEPPCGAEGAGCRGRPHVDRARAARVPQHPRRAADRRGPSPPPPRSDLSPPFVRTLMSARLAAPGRVRQPDAPQPCPSGARPRAWLLPVLLPPPLARRSCTTRSTRARCCSRRPTCRCWPTPRSRRCRGCRRRRRPPCATRASSTRRDCRGARGARPGAPARHARCGRQAGRASDARTLARSLERLLRAAGVAAFDCLLAELLAAAEAPRAALRPHPALRDAAYPVGCARRTRRRTHHRPRRSPPPRRA